MDMGIVSVRMDKETKDKFTDFCKSVGITVSAAVNMFARMTIQENRLPFERRQGPPLSFFIPILYYIYCTKYNNVAFSGIVFLWCLEKVKFFFHLSKFVQTREISSVWLYWWCNMLF